MDHPRDIIEVPAIVEPHQGTSYNPPADAHTELVIKASAVEQQREQDSDKLADLKNKMHGAVESSQGPVRMVGAPGMVLDEVVDEETVEDDILPKKKAPERKTKQQKAKATRVRAEV